MNKHYYRPGYEEGFLPDPEFDETDIRSEGAKDDEILGLIKDINDNEDVANQESRQEDFSDGENDDQVDDLGTFATFDEEGTRYASEVKSKRSNATS